MASRRNLRRLETNLRKAGYRRIAGVDEAGRGCLAGPVFAAAVILPSDLVIPGINDSKLLTPRQREHFDRVIRLQAIAWKVVSIDADEIDSLNILRASLKAMGLVVQALTLRPDFLLVDGPFPLDVQLPQRPVIGGDRKSQTVAAASILAKVSRDLWMTQIDRRYPEYRFARHKGYGTLEHRRAIREYGLTPLHRRSFRLS